jgi:chaperone modulatory protein CbpM
MTTYALVRIEPAGGRMDLETFARAARAHPDFVRRLYSLGLLDASRDLAGNLWFTRDSLHELARIQRLHAGFALDYAACGLVSQLLDRIAALEAAARARPARAQTPEEQSWI